MTAHTSAASHTTEQLHCYHLAKRRRVYYNLCCCCRISVRFIFQSTSASLCVCVCVHFGSASLCERHKSWIVKFAFQMNQSTVCFKSLIATCGLRIFFSPLGEFDESLSPRLWRLLSNRQIFLSLYLLYPLSFNGGSRKEEEVRSTKNIVHRD